MLTANNMKRISNELTRDFNEHEYSCTIFHPNNRHMEINLIVNDKALQFKVTPDYPFKPPQLFVNDINYISRHKDKYLKYKKLFKYIKKYEMSCPCCDTILCNWSPGNTLKQLLDEYLRKEDLYLNMETFISLSIVKYQLPFDGLIIQYITLYLI